MTISRPYGGEQPYIGGKLKFRIPFIHYRLEYQDFIQGLILCVVPLGIVPALTKVMGLPIEAAIFMVMLNNFLYLIHTHFGDPSITGWITAGIPLYITFLTGYAPGPDRIQAMIALQFLVGLIFLVLGATGLTGSIVKHFPISLRAGILLGAGFASLERVFSPAQPFVSKIPISFFSSAFGGLFILFSERAIRFKKSHGWFAWVASFGLAPGFLIGYAIGLLTGEIPPPTGVFDRIFIVMPVGKIMDSFSIFAVGFPPIGHWIAAISLAIVAYVLAFGDILVLQAMADEGNSFRPDEKIVVEVSRNHILCSIRNFILGSFGTFLPLAGPQWTGGQALVINRFKNSTPEEEPSYWGGATSIFWGMSIALLFHPIVQLILPAKDIGFALTLLIQGYLCIYLAFAMCTNNLQRGIAGIMGAMLVVGNYVTLWKSPFWSGPTMGLLVGIILYFTFEYVPSKSKKE
jgi:hypothetical protein